MKKLISLVLAGAMTLSLLPMTAFAATDNRITNSITVKQDDVLGSNAPSLVIKNNKADMNTSTQEFELVLEGAEWNTPEDITFGVQGPGSGEATGKLEKLTNTRARVDLTLDEDFRKNDEKAVTIKLEGVKVTANTAKVTISPKDSAVSADTFVFAKSADGSTITTIEDTTNFYDGDSIKPIFIEEVTKGSFDSEVTLKLSGGFKFVSAKAAFVGGEEFATAHVDVDDSEITLSNLSSYFANPVEGGKSSKAEQLKVYDIKIAEDGADFGKVAEITISGDGDVARTTLEVGTLVDFGIAMSVEDKTLPTIYAGSYPNSDNNENETLEVTLKETTPGSWLFSRKSTLELPEGVKIKDINVDKADNIDNGTASGNKSGVETLLRDNLDHNKMTIPAGSFKNIGDKKAEIKLTLEISAAPDFEGDVDLKIGGPGVEGEMSKTIATVKAPFKVEAANNSVAIDYRNVSVSDITITEAAAGIWEKDQIINLKVENMQFEKGLVAEVVSGDAKIEKTSVDTKNGTVRIEIKSAGGKDPSVIKLSKISLYLDRTLPVGDYRLFATAYDKASGSEGAISEGNDVLFANFHEDGEESDRKKDALHDVDEVTLIENYITVATAARDQGDSTFTTKVVLTLDSTTAIVDGKSVTLDVPAYLSADGRTMLPVRFVAENMVPQSINSTNKPVDYVQSADNSITVMLNFGNSTVSMTTGKDIMYINGSPTPMNTAPVIVNGRTFIPVRDLARALGLDASETSKQVVWDEAARTVTIDPTAGINTTAQ